MSNFGTPIHILTTDFRSGELDPNVRMRVDSKLYASGARSLLNTVLYNTGAVSRRPGTKSLNTQNGHARLLGYEFDEDEKYILSFQNNRLEIYEEDGTLAATFTGSTDCPWTTTTMWELTMKAFANTIFICHESFNPKVMRRTGLSSFTMEDFAFRESTSGERVFQPYHKFEDNDVRLKVSAYTKGSSVTVTADTAIFSADWVGKRIRIYGKELEITAYLTTTTVTATVKERIEQDLINEPLKFSDGSATLELTMIDHGLTTGDSVVISGLHGDYGLTTANVNGTFTVTYKDENTVTYSAAAGSANDSADGGGSAGKVSHTVFTRDWDEQAFSDDRGWPQAVTLHENRLWFAGSTELPDGMFSSVVGDFFDFGVGEGDDDLSVQFAVASNQFTKIRHMTSAGQLLAFSEATEFVVDQREGEPITPGNASVRAQTRYGISYIPPLFFDGAVLYVQRNSKTVREYIYDFSSDNYVSNDLTAAANHLLSTPKDFDIVLGTNTRPEQYACFINSDGTIALYHSIRQEQLAAWVPWATVGLDTYESVCTIGTKMFLSVKRDGNYYLERVEFDDEEITLDFAVTGTSGTPTNSWALGSDYANQVVDVVSSGNYLGLYEADGSGNIVLDYEVTDIQAGYDFGVEIIPMPPDKELTDGAMTGTRRRINAVLVHFRNTTSASINGYKAVTREIGDDISISPDPFDGKKKIHLLGYSRDPVYTITQDEPLLMTVLGAVMEVSQ